MTEIKKRLPQFSPEEIESLRLLLTPNAAQSIGLAPRQETNRSEPAVSLQPAIAGLLKDQNLMTWLQSLVE